MRAVCFEARDVPALGHLTAAKRPSKARVCASHVKKHNSYKRADHEADGKHRKLDFRSSLTLEWGSHKSLILTGSCPVSG